VYTRRITLFSAITLVSVIILAIVMNGRIDVEEIRSATVFYQDVEIAESAGYHRLELEECVESPEGAKGYHYVNASLLDLSLEPDEPEMLIYAPDAVGNLTLVAVEYAVPITAWDVYDSDPPSLFGKDFHVNMEQDLYVLHSWVWQDNPAGMFADYNPAVSCTS